MESMESPKRASKSYEQKLYIMRGVEGEPNQQELEIIRSLERELADARCFVGIAPFGSKMEGYGVQESDIDLLVLLDDSERSIPDQGKRVDIMNGLIGRAKTWVKQMRTNGTVIHIMYECVNPEKIINELSSEIQKGGELLAARVELAAMSRMVTGKKIHQFRGIISSELSKLTPAQKRMVHDTIVNSLVYGEDQRLLKRQERMPEVSPEDHQKILAARKEMWRARIKKIWGL